MILMWYMSRPEIEIWTGERQVLIIGKHWTSNTMLCKKVRKLEKNLINTILSWVHTQFSEVYKLTKKHRLKIELIKTLIFENWSEKFQFSKIIKLRLPQFDFTCWQIVKWQVNVIWQFYFKTVLFERAKNLVCWISRASWLK